MDRGYFFEDMDKPGLTLLDFEKRDTYPAQMVPCLLYRIDHDQDLPWPFPDTLAACCMMD